MSPVCIRPRRTLFRRHPRRLPPCPGSRRGPKEVLGQSADYPSAPGWDSQATRAESVVIKPRPCEGRQPACRQRSCIVLHAVLRDLLSICSRSAHALMLIQVQVRFDAVEANTHVFVAEEPSPLTSPELGYQRAILSHVPPARSSSPTELDDRLMMQGHSALDAAAHDEQDSMLIESRANRALHCPSVESRIPPGPAYAQAYLNALATMSTDGPAEAAEIRRTLAVFLRAWQAVLKAVRQRRRSCALASARLERLRSAGIPTVFGTWRSCAKLAERHRRIGLWGLARARCALLRACL